MADIQPPLPIEYESITDLKRVAEWGFIVFRENYDSDEKYEQFTEKLDKYIEKPIEEHLRAGGKIDQSIRDKLVFKFIDDDDYKGFQPLDTIK
jgi:hypothetical protein